jgi:hypothetical protein
MVDILKSTRNSCGYRSNSKGSQHAKVAQADLQSLAQRDARLKAQVNGHG